MTSTEYQAKCEELETRRFLAEMSDDYRVTCAELRRITLEQIELDKLYEEGK